MKVKILDSAYLIKYLKYVFFFFMNVNNKQYIFVFNI